MDIQTIKKAFDIAIKSLYQMIAAVNSETDECRILDYNPEMKSIDTGTGKFSGLCKSIMASIHPNDREDFRRFSSPDFYPDVLADEANASFDMRIRHADGKYYWSEVMLCHASQEDSVTGNEYLLLIRDINKKKTTQIKKDAEMRAVISELQDRYDAIFAENMIDAQTGCYNRKGMKYYSDMVLSEAKESEEYIFVCVADLNGLKYINDTYGHQAGDVAIAAISKALLESAPEGSRIVRTGGDEFLIFAALQKDSKEPEAMGGKLDAMVDDYNSTQSNEYTVGVSYGYVFLPVKPETLDLDEYIGIADAKMYDMKVSRDKHRRD